MRFLHLIMVFFFIGAFSFGGGIAMLPLIFQMVQEYHMLSPEKFSDLIAVSQAVPGAVAPNAATYTGLEYAGITGGILAACSIALPSFIIVLIVMKFMGRYRESRIVQGLFEGMRPTVIGLISAAVIFIAGTSIYRLTPFSVDIIPLGIFIITLILSGKFKINPIIIIVIMGTAGAFLCG